MSTLNEAVIQKLETGMQGFDLIAKGGLPKGRTTLVSGTAGSAKTVFATQFLAEGITKHDERGVFVTFEEPPGVKCLILAAHFPLVHSIFIVKISYLTKILLLFLNNGLETIL